MSLAIRSIIHSEIDALPDEKLEAVLKFLNTLKNSPRSKKNVPPLEAFSELQLDTATWKFNREEANERR